MDLFLHNQIAYDRLIQSLKTNNEACVIQPTGTGKSYIAAKFIKEHPNSNFLCFTSSNYIIDQFNNSFSHEFDNYVFRTYSSLLAKENDEYKQDFDYIILDEFHRAGATEWGKSLKNVLKKYYNSKLIGFSATPIRNDIVEGELRNMALELFNSNIVHHLTIREAFDTGVLTPPKYIKTVIDLDEEYESIIGKISKSRTKNKVNLENFALEKKIEWENSSGVRQILKKHITTERNFIIFCKSKEHLHEMIPVVTEWFKCFFDFNVNTSIVYSNLLNSDKNLIDFIINTKKINNDFNLLFVINQLNEGVHIKNVHGLIFLRPTDSYIIYYQQLGRGLETNSKQSLLFDMVSNFNAAVKTEDFFNGKESFVKTFSTKDLKNEYEDFKFKFKVYDEIESYKNIFLDIESEITPWKERYNQIKDEYDGRVSQKDWLNKQRRNQLKLTEDKIQLMNNLNLIIGFDWREGRMVKTWKDEYLDVFNDTFDDIRLKHEFWINKQRLDFLKNKLETNQIKLMDKLIPRLGMDWKLSIKKTRWSFKYYEIMNFYNEKVHLAFIKEQYRRRNQLKGEQLIMFKKIYEKYVGKWEEVKTINSWEDNYEKILINYEGSGREKDWLRRQKLLMKDKKLTDEKVELLNKLTPIIGYDWKINTQRTFEDGYQEILNSYNGGRVHKNWVLTQKVKWKDNNLTMEQIELLNKLTPIIGYDWKIGMKQRILKKK